MSLINKLKAKSCGWQQKREEVIAEIKDWFDKVITKEKIEATLEKYIGKQEIEDRKVSLWVEFWEYHEGCSTTYFRCGGEKWHNPEEEYGYRSHKYKEIELCSINKEVCEYLSAKLIEQIRLLGFSILNKEMKPSRFDYYQEKITIGW